jgi:hypothetical protein
VKPKNAVFILQDISALSLSWHKADCLEPCGCNKQFWISKKYAAVNDITGKVILFEIWTLCRYSLSDDVMEIMEQKY